ncbi:hypothetical protein C1645_877352 [Glomus cerebriforme]|uniref:Uncharacterized protein n=1 Tax=Glomus cerebriforme TaxID=658196 RepID=A0A397SWV5_9GLOM|nr:hypothetical protein C1645_877352 [Glomus cerebriforme]
MEIWRGVWAELSFRKKGNGRSIMVNEFLSEECGWLKLNAQRHQENLSILEEALMLLKLKNNSSKENYFTNASPSSSGPFYTEFLPIHSQQNS